MQLENGRVLLMLARFPYGRHARDAGWIKLADLDYDDPTENIVAMYEAGREWRNPSS